MGNTAKVYSSSRNKFYTVTYDPETESIMANDNASFWKGYLGYPSIAFLMQKGIVSYTEKAGTLLRDIPWKDINQQFKNDFDKTLEYILAHKTESEKELLAELVHVIDAEITKMGLRLLGNKMQPPHGY